MYFQCGSLTTSLYTLYTYFPISCVLCTYILLFSLCIYYTHIDTILHCRKPKIIPYLNTWTGGYIPLPAVRQTPSDPMLLSQCEYPQWSVEADLLCKYRILNDSLQHLISNSNLKWRHRSDPHFHFYQNL